MTRTPNQDPRSETGLLRCQTETAVSAHEQVIEELTEANANQRERILELEATVSRQCDYLEGMAELNAEAVALRQRVNALEILLEEIRNGDPGVENMPKWKALFGFEE